MNIALCDPKRAYEAQKTALDAAFQRVMKNGRYILGPETEAFEKEFADWTGAPHCVGVANGTDAVELALRASGVRAGDAVATVSHTAVATVAAVERLGAVPVLTDVELSSSCMSPESLERVLKRHKARAVLPVHLYGQCANMDAIMALAGRHGAKVVEDCAQAHGAAFRGKMAGTFGDAAAFSFYPTKNLGAFGDGGAVLVKNEDAARHARQLRQYGWHERYISDFAGFNSRLDELQAAFLRVRLGRLEQDNGRRRQIASRYMRHLADLPGITLPLAGPATDPVWHLFVVRIHDGLRDEAARRLQDRAIGVARHYPLPVHLQPAYRGRLAIDGKGLPNTEKLCGEILSLPMHPHLADNEVDYVCSVLGETLRELHR